MFGIHFAIDLISAASYEQACRKLLEKDMPSCDNEECRRVTDKARDRGLHALLPQGHYPTTWVHEFDPLEVAQERKHDALSESVVQIISKANKENISDFEWGVACMRTDYRFKIRPYISTDPGEVSFPASKLRTFDCYTEVRDYLYHWDQDLCRIHGDPCIDVDRRCQTCVDEERRRRTRTRTVLKKRQKERLRSQTAGVEAHEQV